MRLVDLDDVCAVFDQDATGTRPGHDLGEVQDADARQRPGSLLSSSSRRWPCSSARQLSDNGSVIGIRKMTRSDLARSVREVHVYSRHLSPPELWIFELH